MFVLILLVYLSRVAGMSNFDHRCLLVIVVFRVSNIQMCSYNKSRTLTEDCFTIIPTLDRRNSSFTSNYGKITSRSRNERAEQ